MPYKYRFWWPANPRLVRMDSQSCCSCDSAYCVSDSSVSFLSDASGSPLYRMGSLLSSLPNKRGLSRFYTGKSQTFSCLADVKCVEQLAKPVKNRTLRKTLSTATAVE